MSAKRILSIIKEMMVANAPGGSGAYGSNADPLTKGGFDPLMGFRNKKKGNVDFRKVPNNYKSWVKNLKNK
jgi:hypothetical protein